MGLKLTPLQVRDKLKEQGYDLSKHPNHMSSIHAVLKRIRAVHPSREGTLSTRIREILKEEGEL
jgi:fido (protein-threonine AMPylation protein)